ncbi:MAG: sigma-70 family RNA polymerase sigma factor [Opitutaceae bacterium]|nr:sigma-70 family RNA polymerase sigma factor [Opitutaceae bacterium]
MPSDPESDRRDFLALRGGDDNALDRILGRWEQTLFGFAYRYVQNESDARDLAAETLVRLYENRADLREDTRLSAWLFTTLANLCRNHLRWRSRHPSVPLEEEVGGDDGGVVVASSDPSPRSLAMERETLAAVQNAIEQLPHDLKVTLLLYYFENLSYREIGAVLGCAERSVETRLYRARQQLRPLLSSLS